MMKKSLAAVAAALLLHGVAYAGAAASESTDADSADKDAPASTWAAQAQLGLIVTSGNTTTKSGTPPHACRRISI
jgi:putative salt-induced outer membrane protein YdiY